MIYMFPGGRRAEAMVHAALARRRVKGEWFEWSRNIVSMVEFLLT